VTIAPRAAAPREAKEHPRHDDPRRPPRIRWRLIAAREWNTKVNQTVSHSTHPPIEHVVVAVSRPYDQVVAALDARLGPARDWEAIMRPLLAAGASWEQVQEALAAHIGASGLSLFYQVDHSPLLALVGKTSRAKQYTIGNPLLAVQMTRHAPEAALYAPLRIVVYATEEGDTFVAYDRFTSFIAQYQREEMAKVARVVERELDALIAAASRGDVRA